MSIVALLLVSCLILWATLYWWRNRRFYNLLSKIPSLKGHIPFLGHAFDFIGADNKKIFELICLVLAPSPQSPRKFWEGPIVYVVVDDPEQIRKVLSSKYCIDKPKSAYGSFAVPEGIFMTSGDTWRQHRKLLDPAFNANVLKSFMPIFNRNSRIFVQMLEAKVNAPAFDIMEELSPLALDTILTTSLGLNENLQTKKSHAYIEDCVEVMKVYSLKLSKIWLKIDFIYRWTDTYKKEQRHYLNGMKLIADGIVEQKEKSFKQNPIKRSVDDGEEVNKPQIFIDQLYKMRDKFGLSVIRDQVETLIFGGFETVSNSLSMCYLLLAMHPRVQDKVYDELQQVFESKDEEVTDEKLDRLVYLEMVLKEAMRLWPTAPFIGRHMIEDITLGDCIVPAGSDIAIPFFFVHRSKKIWGEDAEEFRPERFEPEEFAKIPLYAYNPFSRGPRICIGHKYAMISMKTTSAYFLRNFKVLTTLKMEEIEFEYAILLKIANKCMLSLEKRI